MSGFEAIGAGLAGASRGTKRFGDVLDAQRVLQGNPATGQQVRQRLDMTGFNLRNHVPYADTGMLDGFTFGMDPSGDDPVGPPLQASEDVNPRVIIHARRYQALAAIGQFKGADMAPPTSFQPAFVMRDLPTGFNPRMRLGGDGQESSKGGVGGVYGNGPSSVGWLVDSRPAMAATLLQLNFALAALQAEWAEEDLVGYMQLTPQILMWGLSAEHRTSPFPFIKEHLLKLRGILTYRGWSIDGVPRIVEGEDSDAMPDAYSDDTALSLQMTNQRARTMTSGYVATVVARGGQSVIDLWEGRGITEGARLGFIVKKFPVGNYTRSSDKPNELRYNLTHRGGGGSVRTVAFNSSRAPPDFRFCPYQLIPVAIPSGGLCSLEWKTYTDEWEREMRIDGLFMEFGRVFAAPMRMQFRQPYKSSEHMRPFMDGRNLVEKDRVDCILNPDDGVRSTG